MTEDFLNLSLWYLALNNTRIFWIDLLESWLFLEIETPCPNCGFINKSTWIISLDECEVLKGIRCKECKYIIGEIMYEEVVRFLDEVRKLLRRNILERLT